MQIADDHGFAVFFKRTAHAKTRQNDVVVATRIFLGDRRVIQDGLAPGQGKHGRGRDRERRPLLRLLFLTCNCIRGFGCGWRGFRLCRHRLRFRLDGLRCGLRGAASQKQAYAQQQEYNRLFHGFLLSVRLDRYARRRVHTGGCRASSRKSLSPLFLISETRYSPFSSDLPQK